MTNSAAERHSTGWVPAHHHHIRGRFTICLLGSLFAVCVFAAPPALGHEIRPAFLQIVERANTHYDVLWKQPTMGEVAVHLEPHISGGLLDKEPTTIEAGRGFVLRAWHDLDAGPHGIDGRMVHIEGLDRTITDVLVSVTLANGEASQQIVRPENPTLKLHIRGSGIAVPAYFTLGIEHILTGIDHLCFVFGLMLLVQNRSALVTTLTVFTVAHSFTLIAAALHVIAPRAATIEALVALSIVFVAVELAHSYRGKAGLTTRYPWLIAFAFGLLHGSAFASALAQIGLPPNAVPMSLLLFNVGVEIGQLLFVVAVLGVGWFLTRPPRQLPHWMRWAPPYVIGSFATFWFVQRIVAATG